MCKVIEDMRSEVAREAAWRTKRESVLRGVENGFTYEQMAVIEGLTIEQVKEIAGEKSA